MTKFLSMLACAAPLAFAVPLITQPMAAVPADQSASVSKPATAKQILLARHGGDDAAGDDRGGRGRGGKGRGGNDDGPNHA